MPWTILEHVVQDLRYAFRTMIRSRAFTVLAVLSLALGIGANAVIYSFMDSILLRSLPVSDPESLVVLNWRSKPIETTGSARETGYTSVIHSVNGRVFNDPKTGRTAGIFPFPAFELIQSTSGSVFSSVFAHCPAGNLNTIVHGDAALASGHYVSGEFFRSLAVLPAAGRLLIGDDDRAGAPQVAVISMGFSERRFGGPTNAVGQSILINNSPFTVVGVTPSAFFGVDPTVTPDLYLPLRTNLVVDAGPGGTSAKAYLDQNYYWLEIMGRLRPGVSLTQAQASLAPAFQQWVAGTATNDRERANLPALWLRAGAAGLDGLRRQYAKPLYVLWTMVALLLALTCANTANLLLARAATRKGEMAVRLSIGAQRARVIRQLLTESLLLAVISGALGVWFASGGVRFLTFLLANGRENFTLRAELNWTVLGATLVLSLLCGALFGLTPAIHMTRADVMSALKEARADAPRRRYRAAFLRLNATQALIVAQIAISLLLLTAASLFVMTLSNLQSIQLGFNRENVLLFDVNARQAGHGDAEIAAFYSDLRQRFHAIPGVRAVTLSHSSLIKAGRRLPIRVGDTPTPAARVLNAGPAFFTTMQIPVLRGREIEERDRPDSLPIAVVSELFARTYFGDENPVGRHIIVGSSTQRRALEIVGVSANARYGSLKAEIPPVVYIPHTQQSGLEQVTYALRASGDPRVLVTTVREVVRQADARIPLTNVRTQSAEIDQMINQEIVFARLCTGFALLALVIACVGLYGTTAYAVARRTGEIGIRMALGAGRRTVVWMMLREACLLAAVGLAIGVPIAVASSRFIESFLFGVKPDDLRSLMIAVTCLVAAVLVASYVPVRKATRIDPMRALRCE